MVNRTSGKPGFNRVTVVGLVFLIIANLAQYFLPKSGAFSEGTTDLANGFLFGLAIGSLLLGIWMSTRNRNCPSSVTMD
jgi:peptidoglycan/LPS O-acetylase OafA/YrhL